MSIKSQLQRGSSTGAHRLAISIHGQTFRVDQAQVLAELPVRYTVIFAAWVNSRCSVIGPRCSLIAISIHSHKFQVGQAWVLTDLPAFWVGSAMS